MYRPGPWTALILVSLLPQLTAQNEAEGTKISLPKMKSLTVTGEYRLRYENFVNYDLNTKLSDHNDRFTQRVRLAFLAEITDEISAFVQLQDARNWGEELSTTDDTANGLDIHQGWAKWKGVPGVGGDGKLGRQVLAFGDQRLVGGLEWLSQGRAFDGYRHTWKKEDAQTIDVFAAQIRELMPSTVYDDAFFGGGYVTFDSADDMEFETYLLYLRNDETVNGGTENRVTVGARWEQNFAGGWSAGAELATQSGEVDNADIPIFETYAVHAHAKLRTDDGTMWARVDVDTASGNDPGSSDNERFNNLFPTPHAPLGMMDLALWSNVLHGSVQLGTKPDERSKVILTWHVFESVEETDRFAGPAGAIAPTGAPAGSSNSIGNEIDLTYRIDLDTKPADTWIEAGWGVFLPGSGAKVVATDDDMAHFIYVMSGVRF